MKLDLHEYFKSTVLPCPAPDTVTLIQTESQGMSACSQHNNSNTKSGTETIKTHNYCQFLFASQVPHMRMLWLTFWVVNHMEFSLKSD